MQPMVAPRIFMSHRTSSYRSLCSVFPLVFFIASLAPIVAGQSVPSANGANARSQTDQRIAFYQSKLRSDPDFYMNYNRLASAYLQKARESGDLSYFNLAEKALTKSLELESQEGDASVTYQEISAVHFSEHRFAEAAAEARKALEIEPEDLSTYAYLGDALIESGDYAGADAAYAKLTPPDDDRPHHQLEYLQTTRLAAATWMKGKAAESIAWLQRAVDIAVKIHLPAENIAWTHFMMAEEYFQCGDLQSAENHARASLAAYPGYHRALAETGRIYAARGDFEQAASFYKKAVDVVPFPAYASALVDIYRAAGNAAEEQHARQLVEFIGHLGQVNGQVYDRDLAMFYADHDQQLATALVLAKKELEVRHDIYTWDCLAWVLLKNGKPVEAQTAMKNALVLGTRDSMLFYHAGMIENALGHKEASEIYLRSALAANPKFHVFYADAARHLLSKETAAATSQ